MPTQVGQSNSKSIREDSKVKNKQQIERYFELKRQYCWANLRRKEIERLESHWTDGLPAWLIRILVFCGVHIPRWDERGETLAYKEADAEARRIYYEKKALVPFLIRTNLENLGIEDVVVVGVLYYSDDELLPNGGTRLRDGKEAGRTEMLLSDLCGLGYYGLVSQLGVKNISYHIHIEVGGERIGYIDSDHRFHYEAASNIRTALGWAIATDGGRERVIEFFDLDRASKLILEAIRDNGLAKESFFGPYFAVTNRIFTRVQTSRFGSAGHLRIALWKAATRELGEEHPGYNFAC